MPKVCINRPNRTRKRVFTARDCGRIARYAFDDGADRIEIMTRVAKGLGVSSNICRIRNAINVLLDIRVIVAEILISTGGASLLAAVISILSSPLIKRIPVLGTRLILLLAILVNIQKIIDTVNAAIDQIGFLETLIDDITLACELTNIWSNEK